DARPRNRARRDRFRRDDSPCARLRARQLVCEADRGKRDHRHRDLLLAVAHFVRRDGLLLRVGSKRWKWWQRNRLRMMGRVPFVTKRRRVVMIAKWAARQPGAATSYLYGGVPGIGSGTHTDCSGFVLAVDRRGR